MDTGFSAPTQLAEAVEMLSRPGAVALSGGTDLLVQLRGGRSAPALIVDLKRIDELQQINFGEQWITIGAAVTGQQITDHAELQSLFPGFVEGVGLIGSTQVQGRATPVGNLCNGSPAADAVPAMIAAGAVCDIVGPNGARQLPVVELPVGPGKIALEQGEIVTAINLPRPRVGQADAYLRFIPRTEMDIAVAGAAVNLTCATDGIVENAAVAIGAVAPTAMTVPAAADALVGSKLDDTALTAAAAAVSAAASPISDKRGPADYRRRIVGVLVRRAALLAAERAKQSRQGG